MSAVAQTTAGVAVASRHHFSETRKSQLSNDHRFFKILIFKFFLDCLKYPIVNPWDHLTFVVLVGGLADWAQVRFVILPNSSSPLSGSNVLH